MTDRRCSRCRHFERYDEDSGTCLRYPPVLVGSDRADPFLAWQQPVVHQDDRCGEFTLDGVDIDATHASSNSSSQGSVVTG